MLLTDILDLLKLQPKPLSHYAQYSLTTTLGIALFISLVLGLTMPIEPSVSTGVNLALALISMLIVITAVAVFFKFWLSRKERVFTLQAVFNLIVFTGVVDLLFVPLVILGETSDIFLYLQLPLIAYSLLIFLKAISKGGEVSMGYTVGGTVISFIAAFALIFMTILIFIALGLLPMPTLPPMPAA
jgi:hypothetical protein